MSPEIIGIPKVLGDALPQEMVTTCGEPVEFATERMPFRLFGYSEGVVGSA